MKMKASEFYHGISLRCGCTAAGTVQKPGEEAFVGCGIHDCTDVVEAPDLTGRIARCSYHQANGVPSSTKLAFFRHHPEREYDEYYCGCFGWD